MSLNIVLYKPEIPPNTGNIARLCVGISGHLHIVDKPAFDLSEKAVRRAGLDYWEHLRLTLHENWESFLTTVGDTSRIFLVTKRGESIYTKVKFHEWDYLLFGRETKGVTEEIFNFFPPAQRLNIPMSDNIRSHNLSNSVAIVTFEALRQINCW